MPQFHETEVPPGLRIMMIDDDSDARQLMRMLFDASHLWPYLPAFGRLYEVASGEAAIECLCSLPDDQLPHLILCDVEMPGMTGWQMVCELRLDLRFLHIPVVMVSGRANDSDFSALAAQHGVTQWLAKPLDSHQAVQVIGSVLHRRLPRSNVLVVALDHGWETQKMTRAMLERHGYDGQVRTVNGPAQALLFLQSAVEGIGCIIADVRTVLEHFQDYDGLQRYAAGAGIPMIFLGDAPGHLTWAASQKAPYFEKPINWSSLLVELEKLVPPQAVGVPRAKLAPTEHD